MNINKFREHFSDYNDVSDADLATALHKRFFKGLDWGIFKDVFLDPIVEERTKEVPVFDPAALVKAISDMTRTIGDSRKQVVDALRANTAMMERMMGMDKPPVVVQAKAPEVKVEMPKEDKKPSKIDIVFTYDEDGRIVGSTGKEIE